MVVYNVTVKIEHSIHDEWLSWMKSVHIPDVMNTGLFVENKFLRLLEQDETDGITYAIQYYVKSMSDYFTYQENHAAELQKEHTEKYKDKFVAFRTLLKVVK